MPVLQQRFFIYSLKKRGKYGENTGKKRCEDCFAIFCIEKDILAVIILLGNFTPSYEAKKSGKCSVQSDNCLVLSVSVSLNTRSYRQDKMIRHFLIF